ncbi:Ubiquitin carboxyl-terminal hydrolase 26 [Auxenochlorella protothecoides]|nr:Ubiquitin carboxyl-terminal hydrolase 26 [Auxenochlorella protothecoides]KFM28707.1 Ubiquitin carboxyl-terminal hydrolase 26 [Auxenochlorella protothecoides]
MQRGDLAVPVGLVNLGSTCYANAVLQTLYAIPPFRQALYAARPPLSQDPVVAQLRELFACMEWGRRDPLDPGPLVAALQLDHAVQQDGQEFMKLFLGLLEARFQAQNPLDALLRHLFRGESGYETRCCRCGRASASSGRREGYYELAVPVSGFQTLPESLTSLLAPETLSGSNSLACEYCGTKTEAERQLRLASTPPLLCISLQRFVFDYRKMDRVKINEALACPLTLDFASILSPDQGAAVAHVNHSMFSSQYPAGSSAWWRFDDTAVSALASGPRASSDHGSALALQAANAKLPPEVAAGSIASCTAYQLLYRREDAVLPSVALSEAAEAW